MQPSEHSMDVPTIATVATAFATVVISYLLQKPYVRVVKMFNAGRPDHTTYKLKNAGAATAICIVLQDRYQHVIDLDLRLGQDVRYVDALNAGAEIKIRIRDAREPMSAYYENLFGLLFRTELSDAGNRFNMTARKVWPFLHAVPDSVWTELPSHWWRRR